jgi:enoyl-CoA hydratase/carnithine racemase
MGLVPGDGGAWALPRAVGMAKAAEMLFTGDIITADEARDCGLVSRVVAPEDLLATTMALARRVATNPPRTLRLTKRLLTDAQNMRLGEILEISAAFQAIAHETADHAEAVDAFIEKRPPVFTGR